MKGQSHYSTIHLKTVTGCHPPHSRGTAALTDLRTWGAAMFITCPCAQERVFVPLSMFILSTKQKHVFNVEAKQCLCPHPPTCIKQPVSSTHTTAPVLGTQAPTHLSPTCVPLQTHAPPPTPTSPLSLRRHASSGGAFPERPTPQPPPQHTCCRQASRAAPPQGQGHSCPTLSTQQHCTAPLRRCYRRTHAKGLEVRTQDRKTTVTGSPPTPDP